MGIEARDETWMRLALREAEAAAEEGEIPVGAVFVFEGRPIARTRNQCEMLCDPTAHAEMVGITQACAALECQRLVGVTVYVTKEPCPMCAGALVHARVDRLVIGVLDEKAGACGSVLQVAANERLNHRVAIDSGVLASDSRSLLQDFFRRRRP